MNSTISANLSTNNSVSNIASSNENLLIPMDTNENTNFVVANNVTTIRQMIQPTTLLTSQRLAQRR